MLSAHDVADFFLSPVAEEEGEQITNLKLQKLLYYAQGYSLAILDRPLFADKIENWPHGPVIPCVYQTYKQYGAGLLPVTYLEPDKYQADELYILNRVRTEQGRYTAWALREKTHQEAPWQSTLRGQEISREFIREYFRRTLPRAAFNYDLNRIKERAEGDFVSVPEFDNPQDLVAWMGH
jgi:phage-associated protein